MVLWTWVTPAPPAKKNESVPSYDVCVCVYRHGIVMLWESFGNIRIVRVLHWEYRSNLLALYGQTLLFSPACREEMLIMLAPSLTDRSKPLSGSVSVCERVCVCQEDLQPGSGSGGCRKWKWRDVSGGGVEGCTRVVLIPGRD